MNANSRPGSAATTSDRVCQVVELFRRSRDDDRIGVMKVVHLHSVAAGQHRLKKRIGPDRHRAQARPPHITHVYPQTRDAPNITIGLSHIAGVWDRVAVSSGPVEGLSCEQTERAGSRRLRTCFASYGP
jgi:hypothetical protein